MTFVTPSPVRENIMVGTNKANSIESAVVTTEKQNQQFISDSACLTWYCNEEARLVYISH